MLIQWILCSHSIFFSLTEKYPLYISFWKLGYKEVCSIWSHFDKILYASHTYTNKFGKDATKILIVVKYGTLIRDALFTF
jgi:hypothetical protein